VKRGYICQCPECRGLSPPDRDPLAVDLFEEEVRPPFRRQERPATAAERAEILLSLFPEEVTP